MRYLGDGVYAAIERGMIRLRTERDDGMHVIYLEQEAYLELVRFYSDVTAPHSDDGDHPVIRRPNTHYDVSVPVEEK